MSLRSTSGTSLVEVMVMMVILGIAIVGIYSMVNRGRELADLTNTRLSAVNIAREWLESVTTLRDTFALNGYESGACWTVGAFFSVDGHILLDDNCPLVSGVSSESYILSDLKTLTPNTANPTNFDVCMNEYGWYSQEQSMSTWATVDNCANPGVSSECSCTDTLTFCEENTTKSCKTTFKRKITFSNSNCPDPKNTQFCIEITSKVWWWETEPTSTDSTQSLTLSQIITPLD